MIDLMPFCSTTKWYKKSMLAPWSHGEYTYATDGNILIRVPRRADVPERPDALDTSRSFAAAGVAPAMRSLAGVRLPAPPPEEEKCPDCDGTGDADHDCPECACDCETCDGRGIIGPQSTRSEVTVGIGGVPFDAKYIRLILALPNARMAAPKYGDVPAWFAFEGGDGLLMSMRDKAEEHIDLDAGAAP